VSYVFDFEKTCYSPRTFELLRSLTYCLLADVVTKEELVRARLYCDAYRSVYPLSNEELQKGLKLFCVRSLYGLWVEEEHYLKNNTRADHFHNSFYMRTVYFNEHYDELEKSLLV
jgi:Ser/Thr protein kinase RdoA (MazF antagonist)